MSVNPVNPKHSYMQFRETILGIVDLMARGRAHKSVERYVWIKHEGEKNIAVRINTALANIEEDGSSEELIENIRDCFEKAIQQQGKDIKFDVGDPNGGFDCHESSVTIRPRPEKKPWLRFSLPFNEDWSVNAIVSAFNAALACSLKRDFEDYSKIMTRALGVGKKDASDHLEEVLRRGEYRNGMGSNGPTA